MDNRKILPKVIIFALFIILCGIIFRFLVVDTRYYYTIVDNTNVVGISSKNKVNYEYTLNSYDENGNKRKLTFKTSKLLKEGSYLKLKASLIRGVIKKEEIKKQKLPNNVIADKLNYNTKN